LWRLTIMVLGPDHPTTFGRRPNLAGMLWKWVPLEPCAVPMQRADELYHPVATNRLLFCFMEHWPPCWPADKALYRYFGAGSSSWFPVTTNGEHTPRGFSNLTVWSRAPLTNLAKYLLLGDVVRTNTSSNESDP